MFTHLRPAPAWYTNSLSRALHTVAETYQNDLPRDVYATIQEAAGRVRVHEEYTHDKYADHSDLDRSVVYNGYKMSLVNLSTIVNRPGLRESQTRICRHIFMTLQDILIVIESKGNDVGQLFSDPEMSKLLVKLASAL